MADYDVAGPAGARPVVLLHGAHVTRKMWGPQMEALSDEFRLIAPDLPGHGALAAMEFRFESAVREVADLIDREAGGRALIVGLSLGGYTAMQLAFQHPQKAAGLVLADCSREPRGVALAPHRFAAAAMRTPAAGWFAPFTQRFFRARYPPMIAEPILLAGFYPKGGAEAVAEILSHTYLPRLAEYPGPILVINGEEDFVFRAGEEEFVRTARDGRLVVIPQAAHASNIDAPEAFNAAVRAFARALPS